MWRTLAEENFDAASSLCARRKWRSSVSRAYYAVFSMVTAALIQKGLTPRQTHGTWSHESLPGLIGAHLLDRSAAASNMAYAVWRLYRLRVVADYAPQLSLGRVEAMEATGLMHQVVRQMQPEWSS